MGPWLLPLAVALAGASSAPAIPNLAWPFPEVQRTVLDNGLTVLIASDHSSPLVSVAVMYTVGARNEAAGITGLAHYVEHMNFRASRRFPGSEITEAITRIGGRWNGYTWIDQTFYAETVPRDALDAMLDLERDRMTEALYDPEDFRKERTSVIAELHSYDDPASVLYDAVLAAAFEIHPYRHNTIGWLTDVEAVTRDEAYRFYRRFYHPNNAVLVVVGDMDSSTTLEKVRRRFGELPAAGEATRVRTVEPPQAGERRVVVRRPGPHGRVLLAFRAPALRDPDFAAMVLFDALLAGGKGFRFTREYPVPDDTPLGRAAEAAGARGESDWQASHDPYVYTLAADVPGEDGLAAAEQALFRAVEEAAAREWTDQERATALRQVLTGWASDLDDKAGRAHQLAFFEVCGSLPRLFDLPVRLAAVTREDLQRFARERLKKTRATVGWLVPTAAQEAPAGGRPVDGRDAPAPAGAASSPRSEAASPAQTAPPPPASRRLRNGLRLTVAPSAGSALVALRGRLEAGSLFDGDAPGLSALATELLARPPSDEPAGPAALSWTLHREPSAASASRWIELSAHSLPADLPALLGTVAARLRRAQAFAAGGRLGPGEWEAVRDAAARRAREQSASAGGAVWRRARAELYSPGSALARPAWADPDAIAALTPEALRSFLRAHGGPGRVRIVLTGALDARAAGVAERELAALEASAVESRAPSVAAARTAADWREVSLPWPAKPQDDIRVVWPGDRSRPSDRPATELLLYLLGETGYAGRLGRALVDPGLVYSAYASLEEEGAPGFLMVRTASAPRDTPEVLRRIRALLEESARGGFTEAELREAQAYLRGKRARAREGSAAAALDLSQEKDGGFGPDPQTLTLEQLNDTARRFFAHGAPVAVVAGPPRAP